MTILRLKNPTNIYRIDAKKKLGGKRGYLALKDLRIKSKFLMSNMPIREVERSGERKNPRGGRKKGKKARAGRLRPGLKHKLGASHLDAELGVGIYDDELGARVIDGELSAMSPLRLLRA